MRQLLSIFDFRFRSSKSLMVLFLLCVVFFSGKKPAYIPPAPVGKCGFPEDEFKGYSFILPDIVQDRSAYAPFLLHFKGKYKGYFSYDIQKKENLSEWNERFCSQCQEKDIEKVIYLSLASQLAEIRSAAEARDKNVYYSLAGNSFADAIVEMGCTDVVDYLVYAKRCEPYATREANWELFKADTAGMNRLIRHGYSQVLTNQSHFLKMRYAYQIVRLMHYSGRYKETLRLYTDVCKKIDFRKPSITFYWLMGHQAGALQKLGQYPEAAYRFSLVFRNCPSKRIQAFRSFVLRNQTDWEEALKLCRNNSERATLHIMRIAADPEKQLIDLEEIYRLDPSHPLLDVLLVGEMQEIEPFLLRSRYTNLKHSNEPSKKEVQHAAQHLIGLRRFVVRALKEKKLDNPLLWEASEGYLALMGGDFYQSNKTFSTLQKSLNHRIDHEAAILKQVEHWDLVGRIRQINPDQAASEDAAHALQGFTAFSENPDFQGYYSDVLATAYEDSGHPGKALVFAFDASALRYNPTEAILDDMIRAALKPNKSALENTITTDSLQLTIADDLISMKAEQYFEKGKLDAAFEIFKTMSPYRQNDITFTPFKETIKDCVHCIQADSLTFSRRDIVRQLLKYEQRARAAEALKKPEAAYYHYLIGLAYYNMSYFGHAWNVTDRFRSGNTWSHLSEGPIFPHKNAPLGNKENLNVNLALKSFIKCIELSKNPEMAARGAFMAARCQQKQYFCSPNCTYKFGNKFIPEYPEAYKLYGQYFVQNFVETKFYGRVVEECSWIGAY